MDETIEHKTMYPIMFNTEIWGVGLFLIGCFRV